MTGNIRIATTLRETFALTITSDQGQDLATKDRQVALRVALAADDLGYANGFDVERISKVMRLSNAETRAALRRLQRARWIESDDLESYGRIYDLQVVVPWHSTPVPSAPRQNARTKEAEVSA